LSHKPEETALVGAALTKLNQTIRLVASFLDTPDISNYTNSNFYFRFPFNRDFFTSIHEI
jgi:hypothetical protein